MAGGSPGAWAGGSGGPGIPLALGQACVAVSALTGSGLPGLVEMLAARARQRIGDLGYDIIVNERHAVHLRSALEGVRRGLESLSRSLPMDFIASDIRHTIDCLGEISGRRVASRVLDEIFSRFCIGK
jgi:tRNA modification GTPase